MEAGGMVAELYGVYSHTTTKFNIDAAKLVYGSGLNQSTYIPVTGIQASQITDLRIVVYSR